MDDAGDGAARPLPEPRPRLGSAAWWRSGWSEPIRRRPVPIAITAALVVAALAWRLGPAAYLPAFAYLGVAGTLLAYVDAALRRLPDPLTLPSYAVGLAALGGAAPFTGDGGARLGHALIGLAALWLVFAVQWFVVPGAIGFGDVKLAGVLGLYLGWLGIDTWWFGLVAMFCLGGFYAIGLLVTRRAARGSTIPFGPFMLAGALAAVLLTAS